MKRVSLKSSRGGGVAVNDGPSARILESDGVQHSGGGLGNPMRGVAEARRQGGTLEAHGARIVVRETDHTGILLTETHTTREQYQRGVESSSPQKSTASIRLFSPITARVPQSLPSRAPSISPSRSISTRNPAQYRQCYQALRQYRRRPAPLIAPLAFTLDDAKLRRAGLDYREWARVACHDSLNSFLATVRPARLFAFLDPRDAPLHGRAIPTRRRLAVRSRDPRLARRPPRRAWTRAGTPHPDDSPKPEPQPLERGRRGRLREPGGRIRLSGHGPGRLGARPRPVRRLARRIHLD